MLVVREPLAVSSRCLFFFLGDDERHRLQIADDPVCLGLGVQLGLVAVNLVQAGFEVLAVLEAQRLDRPVLNRGERPDFALALHQDQ